VGRKNVIEHKEKVTHILLARNVRCSAKTQLKKKEIKAAPAWSVKSRG